MRNTECALPSKGGFLLLQCQGRNEHEKSKAGSDYYFNCCALQGLKRFALSHCQIALAFGVAGWLFPRTGLWAESSPKPSRTALL